MRRPSPLSSPRIPRAHLPSAPEERQTPSALSPRLHLLLARSSADAAASLSPVVSAPAIGASSRHRRFSVARSAQRLASSLSPFSICSSVSPPSSACLWNSPSGGRSRGLAFAPSEGVFPSLASTPPSQLTASTGFASCVSSSGPFPRSGRSVFVSSPPLFRRSWALLAGGGALCLLALEVAGREGRLGRDSEPMGRASEGAVTAEDAEHGEKARTDAAAKDREARRGRGEGAASQEETREAPLTLCDEFAHTQRLEEAALRDSRQTTQRSVADGQEGGSEGERERAADRDGSRSASELHPAEANAEACGRDPDGAVVSLPERCESADLEEQSECLPEHLRLAFFVLLDDERARALPSPASSSAPSASRPPSAPTPPSSWSSSGP